MHVWNVLHAARWKYRTQKIAILAPSDNFVGLYLLSWGMYRQLEKNLLNIDTSSTCPHNMVNFGTPANFNGFRVLAALLHGTLVVGVSQTLRRWIWLRTGLRPPSNRFELVRAISKCRDSSNLLEDGRRPETGSNPNFITLSASKLVWSWSQTGSKLVADLLTRASSLLAS